MRRSVKRSTRRRSTMRSTMHKSIIKWKHTEKHQEDEEMMEGWRRKFWYNGSALNCGLTCQLIDPAPA